MDTKITKNKKVVVYENLRRQIIDGMLSPGSPIDEARIAQGMGVSKTPVREALRQLENSGLVENIPGRGSMVSYITPDGILETFTTREIIECGAAKRIALGADREKLHRELGPIIENGKEEADRTYDLDYCTDIHTVLVDLLGNQQLSNIYRGLLDQIIRIRNYFDRRFTKPRLAEIEKEHQAIIFALFDGNAELAEEMVSNHLKKASKYLIGQL